MVSFDFKNKNPFDRRLSLSKKILDNHDDRIPVICEKSKNSDIPDIDNVKYIVPSDFTFGKFINHIRSRIKLPAEKAMYMMVGNDIIPVPSHTLSEVYNKYKDEDGFLYVIVTGENTFGK